MKIKTHDGFELDASFCKNNNSKKLIVFAHGMTVQKDDEGIFIKADKMLYEKGF